MSANGYRHNGNGHRAHGRNGNGFASLEGALRLGRVHTPRIAVVGLGYWGPNLVRNLHELPDADLACVCDARESALETIARRYPAVPGTTRFEDLIADPTIDAVALATPVSTHYERGAISGVPSRLALRSRHASRRRLKRPLTARSTPLATSSAASRPEVSRRLDRAADRIDEEAGVRDWARVL